MSDGLGNLSHYDVGNVSQGFSVWNGEVPGLASNFYFVMPNLYGIGNDARPFDGVAALIRERHTENEEDVASSNESKQSVFV
jgi:hypothetical protein